MSAAVARLRSSRPIVVRVDRLGFSTRIHPRVLAVTALAALVAFAAFIAEIAWGEFPIAPFDALLSLFGAGTPENNATVFDLRLPRALVAALAGIALALSGAVFQTLARNPLASPDIIGVTGGAAFAGVASFVFIDDSGFVPVAAFAGALIAALALYALAWRDGLSPFRFVLVGIGIAAITLAGTTYVLVEGRIVDIAAATVWLVGSVNLRVWGDVWPLSIGLIVLVPFVVAMSRSLDALALGDDSARALGVSAERTRLGLVVVGAALVAIAVAAAGPIAFVALIAPNVGRLLAGKGGAASLPVVAACGAALVLSADFAGRIIFAPDQLPVGIVTAILGAPFFLVLLARANRIRTESG
ncbi:iron ABC transporter permease [Thermoleophilia bacterium SCSIO 60948]|nr:iron ABC transporter permease [Thermoleophilia bacterium SCSIO 60948]